MSSLLIKLISNNISRPSATRIFINSVNGGKSVINRSIQSRVKQQTIVKTYNSHSFWNISRKLIVPDATRCFHCSHRRDSPKLVILLIRPFVAGITGRLARFWWNRQPKTRKARILIKIRDNRNKILYALAAYFGGVVIYWLIHQERAPLTNRIRFMAFTAENLRSISDMAMEQLVAGQEHKILPADDPRSVRVMRVASRIIANNRHLPHLKDEKFTVTVIDEPGQTNAMVTSTFKIVVFVDMLRLCSTDDELAMVLSHELAHAALDHVAEKISSSYLIGFFTAPLVAALWAILPSDIVAFLATKAMNKIVEVSIELPYSRFVETEADEVGLDMAAKACYDVRSAIPFWLKVSKVEQSKFGVDSETLKDVEYFLTHPTSESRAEHLHSIMDKAIKKRVESGCPPLREFSAITGYNFSPPLPVVILPF